MVELRAFFFILVAVVSHPCGHFQQVHSTTSRWSTLSVSHLSPPASQVEWGSRDARFENFDQKFDAKKCNKKLKLGLLALFSIVFGTVWLFFYVVWCLGTLEWGNKCPLHSQLYGLVVLTLGEVSWWTWKCISKWHRVSSPPLSPPPLAAEATKEETASKLISPLPFLCGDKSRRWRRKILQVGLLFFFSGNKGRRVGGKSERMIKSPGSTSS